MGVIPSGPGSASGILVGSVNGVGAAVDPGVGEAFGVEMEAGLGGVSSLDVAPSVAPAAAGSGVFAGNAGVAAMPLGVGASAGVRAASVQASRAARMTITAMPARTDGSLNCDFPFLWSLNIRVPVQPWLLAYISADVTA